MVVGIRHDPRKRTWRSFPVWTPVGVANWGIRKSGMADRCFQFNERWFFVWWKVKMCGECNNFNKHLIFFWSVETLTHINQLKPTYPFMEPWTDPVLLHTLIHPKERLGQYQWFLGPRQRTSQPRGCWWWGDSWASWVELSACVAGVCRSST